MNLAYLERVIRPATPLRFLGIELAVLATHDGGETRMYPTSV